MFERFRKKNNSTYWSIPTDPAGYPYFVYNKVKDWINGIENYRYQIWGNLEYRPDEIEGKPIPVGSTFFDWKTWTLYIMRNWGWATKDEEDVEPQPEIFKLIAKNSAEETQEVTKSEAGEFEFTTSVADDVLKLENFESSYECYPYLTNDDGSVIGEMLEIGDTILTCVDYVASAGILWVNPGVEPTSIDDGTWHKISCAQES